MGHGRTVGTVALLFGMSGRAELPGHALRALLGDLGLSDDASRALLSRMRRRGQLATTRHGREASYRLAGSTARGFEYIRRRTSEQQTTDEVWDGVFHTLLHSVPETHRAFRDALRRSAYLAGYGTLQPGVLVAPADYRVQLADTLVGRPEEAQLVFGQLTVDDGDAARLVEVAWDLPRVAATYAAHLAAVGDLLAPTEDPTGAAALRAYGRTVAPALSATLAEPDVPAHLLPEGWPGQELRARLAECRDRVGRAAAARVADLVGDVP